MKGALIAVVLLVGCGGELAAQDITGIYDDHGTNADGSSYSGSALIEATSADTCSITWQIGDTTYDGICMRSGNILSAAYGMGEMYGLVIYQIEPDGTLNGVWTVDGYSGVGTDILTPIRY